MSDITKLPRTEIPRIPTNYNISPKTEETGRKFGNFDFNQLMSTIGDVAEATTAVAQNTGNNQDQFGNSMPPQYYPQNTGRWNEDIPSRDGQTRILGMKPLVFTITAIGVAGVLALVIYYMSKSKKA